MRRSFLVAGILVVLAMLQAVAASSVEQFRAGDVIAGGFTNRTGVQVDGLLLVFEGSTEIVNSIPIGGDMVPTLNVNGEIRFGGWLDPNGEILIDWPADGPRLVRAAWLLAGEAIEDLCVLCPSARILIDAGHPLVGEEVTFRSFSEDPHGLALVHRWEWEDGTTAVGEVVTRTFQTPEDHEVTLTVVNEEGLTGQATRHFLILREQRPEPLRFELLVSVTVTFYPPLPSSAWLHVSGPGIDIEVLFAGTASELLANDPVEAYPEGTSVTLAAEVTSAGDVMALDRWTGCDSCAGSTCTVVMNAQKTVRVYFITST